MKKIIYILLLFLVANGAFAAVLILKTFNLDDKNDLIASSILYNFILTENKFDAQKVYLKHGISKENTYANYFDLNNDSVSEIIGYNSSKFMCKNGCKLYILSKNNGKYEKIDFVLNIDKNKPIEVLKDKTKGFYNIKITPYKDNKQITVKFDGNSYSIMRL